MTKSIEEILRGSQEIVEEPIEKVTWRQRLEAAESKYSDWLSPILVKELRQSLKSRQFFYTYTAILIAVWCWSIFGIVMLLPAAYYLPAGKPLLFGYLLILAVPSIIIIPLSVHRSLASESDDDTYELLSITSLSARQIVYGKLASGMLQYLLVMSLLTPCFGFSYLLRGFSMGSLFALLAMVSLLTFLSISVGLFFAAQVRGRFGQVLALVAQLAIAVGLFVFANDVSVGLINGVLSSRVNQGDGWLMALSLCALVILIARFLLLVAAARLSPQSENRSTPIRWALLHVQTAFLFFIGLEVFADLALDTTGVMIGHAYQLLIYASSQIAIVWALFGAFMIGESPHLSPRVRRDLPQSILGRLVFGWMQPGPMSGLTMATVGLISGLTVIWLMALHVIGGPVAEQLGSFMLFHFGYITTTWALVAVFVSLLRNQVREGWILSVASFVIVAFMSAFIPYAVGAALSRGRAVNYGLSQITNWVYSYGTWLESPQIMLPYAAVVATVGLIAMIGYLPFTGLGLHLAALATPERVRQEEGGQVDVEPEINPLA